MLARAQHRGPLRVQRPFYPEGDAVAHIYVLHPPGGVVGGDRLALSIEVEPDAAAVITTPAAAKLYRSNRRLARVEVRARVAAGACLEYVPQETIAFAGCHARTSVRVELEPGARFFGWEVIALGRPAAGEAFATGELTGRLELWRAGRPVAVERTHVEGGGELLSAPWGLRGHSVVGTMMCAGVTVDVASALTSGRASVSRLEPDVVVARYLGDDPFEARHCFEALRSAIRPSLLGLPAIEPRIWAT